jgi:sterol desaturase/sphingolipid hydroxylase (fatty acid hydroxylase superfamily)
MMNDTLVAIAEVLHLAELRAGMKYTAGLVIGLGVVFYVLERINGRDPRRYLSRGFRTDLLYTFIYRGGIFTLFVFAPIAGLLNLGLTENAPRSTISAPLAIIFYLVVSDFLAYWLHRLMHAVPVLWAFHSIHHSARQLTFITISRAHFLEGFILFLPNLLAMYICGVPPKLWGPLAFLRIVHEFSLHSDLTWRFGPFYYVIISPMFHGQHHSLDRENFDKNFGSTFGFWDLMFGTAAEGRRRPDAYGVQGMKLPESFWKQQLAPFKTLLRRANRREPYSTEAQEPSINNERKPHANPSRSA